MTTRFADLIPPRARQELEEAAAAAGRSLDEHLEAVGGGRSSVAPAESQGPPMRARVFDVFQVLQAAGDAGATDLEISGQVDGLDAFTVEVCRRELLGYGLVENSGRRIKTSFGLAVVWVLTTKGRELLK